MLLQKQEVPAPARASLAWACLPGWVAMETQRIPLLSAASTVCPPRRDAPQAPAQHGSLLPGAERQRGKAEAVLELSSPLDGTRAPAEEPGWPRGAEQSAVGCGLGVPGAAERCGGCQEGLAGAGLPAPQVCSLHAALAGGGCLGAGL